MFLITQGTAIDDAEEAGRKEWLSHAVVAGDYKTALKYAVGEEEATMINEAKAGKAEGSRKQKFEAAVGAGNYSAATKLAVRY